MPPAMWKFLAPCMQTAHAAAVRMTMQLANILRLPAFANIYSIYLCLDLKFIAVFLEIVQFK